MKILLMHDYNIPVGGACQIFYNEAKLLQSKGHAVHLFTLEESSNNKPHLEGQEYQTVYYEPKNPSVSHFFQKYFSWKLYKTFKQTIKKFNPDIIHMHHNLKSTLSIVLAAKFCHVPIVHTLHDANLVCISSYGVNKKTGELCINGSIIDCFKNRCLSLTKFIKHALLWKVRQWIEKNYVDVILCPSKFLMSTLLKLGYKNLEYLPNFVSLIKSEIKNVNNVRKKLYILYVGRFIELKGIYYLIKSFKTILGTYPQFKLLLIGDGQEKERLESYAIELDIKKKVTFIGVVSRKNLSFYYKNACVFVLPSIGIENSPLTILEALSFSVPIVASNIGGIPELVENGKTGYLFEPRNSQDLADKILKILNNPSLAKKMGIYAWTLYNKYYRPERHYTQLIKIYNNVLSSKK